MTTSELTASMSDLDWDMWTDDIEETLSDCIEAFDDVREAIYQATTKLTNHKAFFFENNADLTPQEQEEQWIVLITSTAMGILHP